MKKLVKVLLVVLFALFISGAFGQGGFVPVYVIPDLTTNFKVNVPANSLVYVQSTDKFYNILVAAGRTVDMTWVLADGSRYDDVAFASLGSTLTLTDSLISPIVDATSKLILGSQILTQNHVNNVLFNNSATATDTLFAPVIKASSKFFLNDENITRGTTTKSQTLIFSNSAKVTDTLFLGGTQWLSQIVGNSNRIKAEGSILATDTVFIGANQWLMQNTTNKIKIEGSLVTGTSDTIAAGNVTTATENVSGLPMYTIAAGTAIPVLLADTINVPVAGLTTSAVIICSYAAYVAPTDTTCYVKTVKTGHFTLCGKNGIPINYWIPKK